MYLATNNTKNAELIIFLHGVGSSHTMWQKHLLALEEYTCIAPDLPGHGKSNDREWKNLNDTADQVAQLIINSNHSKAHVVGLSLGGSIVLNMLSRYADLIDHAIVDGAGIFPIKAKELIKFGVTVVSPFLKYDQVNKGFAQSLGISDPKELESFQTDMKAVSPRAFRTAFAQANDQSEPDGLDKIDSPVLFVAGELEPEATKSSGTYLAKKMKHAKTCIAPKVGHGWLAAKSQLHIDMVRAWFADKPLPKQLKISTE